jgi:hypothetical protein
MEYTFGQMYTLSWTSTVALPLTVIESCEVSARQEQSVSKRLIIYVFPLAGLLPFYENDAKLRKIF